MVAQKASGCDSALARVAGFFSELQNAVCQALSSSNLLRLNKQVAQMSSIPNHLKTQY